MVRTITGLNEPAVPEFFGLYGMRFRGSQGHKKPADAVVPVEKHQDDPEAERVAREFREPVQV